MPTGTREATYEEPLSVAPYLEPNELSGNGRKGLLATVDVLVNFIACA